MHPRLSLRHGSWKIRSTPFTGSNETGRGRVNRSPTSNAWFSSGNVTNTSLETAVFVDRCPEVSARQRSPFVRRSAAVAARGVGFSFWRISSHGFGHRPEKRRAGHPPVTGWLREDHVSASWHFNVDSKGPIHLQARFEGTHSEIKPGQNFRNLTYGQLKRAGAGTIRVNADGSLTMTSDPLG